MRSALLLLLPLLASCSVALSKGPPAGWRTGDAPDAAALGSCSPTRTWGFIDTALSVVSLATGYVASSGRLDADEDRGEHILVGAILGGIFGFGASVGFMRADACEEFLNGSPGRARGPRPIRVQIDEERPSDPSLLTGDDLAEGAESVMGALQRLRPLWLRRTGTRSDLPRVILDNQEYEFDILETLVPEDVDWVRFVEPSDATIRWGTGYTGGAIEVRTRR